MMIFPPGEEELAEAPMLRNWRLVGRGGSALRGEVRDHPLLGTRSDILTSEMFAMDAHGRWARTFSRFYRLHGSSDGN
jgi:hypothetical protein